MTEYSPQWKEKVQPGTHAVQDMEYFQGMYPQRIKELQRYVMYQCDAMDYSGSPIYDEYPETLMIERACQAVCGMLPENWFAADESAEEEMGEEKEETYVVQNMEVIQNRPGGPPPWGPPPGGRPPGGPPPGGPPPWGPPPWGPPPGNRPPGGPPPWGPPPGSPPPGNNWLSDIVKVLFMNEIQRRRCHMGRC